MQHGFPTSEPQQTWIVIRAAWLTSRQCYGADASAAQLSAQPRRLRGGARRHRRRSGPPGKHSKRPAGDAGLARLGAGRLLKSGHVREPAGPDAVGATLVLLHLLKRDAKLRRETRRTSRPSRMATNGSSGARPIMIASAQRTAPAVRDDMDAAGARGRHDGMEHAFEVIAGPHRAVALIGVVEQSRPRRPGEYHRLAA